MFELINWHASQEHKPSFLNRISKSFDENYALWIAEVDTDETGHLDDEKEEVKAYLMWNKVRIPNGNCSNSSCFSI